MVTKVPFPKGTKIDLGDVARDDITGFQGVVICVSKWLHGCERLTLQPEGLDKEGQPHKAASFDEPQLSLMKKKVAPTTGNTGGPRDEPKRGRE